jgi:hypothetical protein
MSPGTVPTYKVEYQTQTVGVGPDGRPTEGWKIGYSVASLGIAGSIFVPSARFNANTVRALIADQLAHHAAVASLGG